MADVRTLVSDKPHERVPFLAVGNVAVGVIAIGNVAFGVVAIGMSLSCGVIAIGMNSVGAIALGLNAAGPFAGGLINALGVVAFALVNALGGLGACLVNEGVHPIVGIVLAVGFLVLGTLMAHRVQPAPPRAEGTVPLGDLPDRDPGKYTVRADVENPRLVDGDRQLEVEGISKELDGEYCECVVEIIDEFEDTEGNYRSAPEKRRRFVLRGGHPIERHPWTRGRIVTLGGRALQLAAIAAGGLCVVELVV